MIRTDEGRWYSASDILNWLGCQHRTSLDAAATTDPALRAFLDEQRAATRMLLPDAAEDSDFDTPAKRRGDEHEQLMLQRLRQAGRDVTEIARPAAFSGAGIRRAATATERAMRAGADVIFQAALLDAPWFGFADFLVRRDDVASDLGAFSYEIRDTKLARHASASALIQMAHYGAMVELIQGTPPPDLVIWLGTGEEYSWPYVDAVPYVREAQARFLRFVSDGVLTLADPVPACASCRWASLCAEQWGDDDLIHVHRLTRHQRALLGDEGITTITGLAKAPDDDRPRGMATSTFERLREQAQVQTDDESYRIVRPQSAVEGLAGIPAPHPADIYFDLEGDPFAAIPTLDYLWAYCDAADNYSYRRWAHTIDAEREAFCWFMNGLRDRESEGGDWHVYHYNTYELTSLRRIAAAWPDPVQRARWVGEVERLITDRFVDLYRAVEKGLRTHDGSTSLKIVEKLAGYDRTRGAEAGAVAKADDSIVAYENFINSKDSGQKADILQGILNYNNHDVRATHAVHLWLKTLAVGLTEDDFTPEPESYLPSEKVMARIERTAHLHDQLLSLGGYDELAMMLEWHRAEASVQYLDFLRLRDWALEEAAPDELAPEDVAPDHLNGGPESTTRIMAGTEHESCLLDVELTEVGPRLGPKATAQRRHSFTCRSGSWKVKAGAHVEQAQAGEDGRRLSFKVEEIDPEKGTFTVLRGSVPDPVGPLVLKPFQGGDVVWEALMRLGEEVIGGAPHADFQVSLDLIQRTPPLPLERMQPQGDEDAPGRARRIAAEMTTGVLAVQGPPGTGKTWLGARLVADAIRRGGRAGAPAVIAVTANSHRVIDNLLVEIASYCNDHQIDVAVGHAGSSDKVTEDARVDRVDGNPQVAAWIADNQDEYRPCVMGATKFAWSRAELQGTADLLVIDEAGQLPLADALAVTQVAPIVVALGDPQQLAAPIQAAHDASIQVSVLEHLAQGRAVLPPEVGVFLDRSHRMHGALCKVVADLAYNGELLPSDEAQRRDISGPAVTYAGVSIPVRPGVAWLPVVGDAGDEVGATLQVIAGLVGKATVTLGDGTRTPLTADQLLVVAPHNAHVNRIAASLPRDIRVGTVDRFQGQQGHVVVFSMGRLAESASDVPFLYELNRINVALSRARLMAIVISQPDAGFPPVSDPEQLMLASRFIRALGQRPTVAEHASTDEKPREG